MSSIANNPAAAGGRGNGIPRVIVATTALLTFISFWRAAAIVLNDLASSAYYAGGEAEGYIGKTAPWFILAIMLFSYAVRAVYVESCSMFVRGGVYRAVKQSLGGALAKFSVSALMFDYILTGSISGVSAGQYLGGLLSEVLPYAHMTTGPLSPRSIDFIATCFAIIVTIYFWWENTKGIPESSEKALHIMKLVTVMVVILIAWCIYTITLRHSPLPPLPYPRNLHLTAGSLGWLAHSSLPHMFGIVAIFIALGHSVLAMSGEESLAQVYREIEHPKLPILISRGDVTFLANLYAFGVIWSFAMNGLAVLVLRYTNPGQREFQVPLNFTIRGVQVPLGLGLITLTLFLIAFINLFTKPVATMAGGAFSVLLYIVFTISERRGRNTGVAHVEMDQFNLELEGELTPESVGARPGNILVPVSNHFNMYHLGNVLDRVKPGRRDVVVLHVRILRRSASGEQEFDADQLFGSIEQHLFSQALSMAEKRGKSIRLAVVAANDLWDGILRAGNSLQSSTIVVGTSSHWQSEEQARQIGEAWEKLPDPKPQFNLEVHLPNGDKVYKVLGPHAPNLTANEVNMLHRLWLRFSDLVAPEELHHHDVVHFSLEEVQRELDEGREAQVVERLRAHLIANRKKKTPGI